jgi:hypothetical protein
MKDGCEKSAEGEDGETGARLSRVEFLRLYMASRSAEHSPSSWRALWVLYDFFMTSLGVLDERQVQLCPARDALRCAVVSDPTFPTDRRRSAAATREKGEYELLALSAERTGKGTKAHGQGNCSGG